MSVFFEKSRSAWMHLDPAEYPRLDHDLSADVVVIGSGIAGLSTAYELSATGKVVLVDRGPIARGMTARTSAHLTSALDDLYHEFIPIRGEDIARLHFQSHAEAIDRIEEIAATEGIDCDFARLNAYLFLAGDAKPKLLDDERSALTRVGLKGVRRTDRPAVRHELSTGPCLIIPEQGRFHPLRYLDGLAAACARRGVDIYADTCVASIEENEYGVTVETHDRHRIAADAVVVATNTPINDRLTIHAKQAPYRTYVFTAEVPAGAIDDALYWDTEEPYHYVRLHPFGEKWLLLVGGEDHKTGAADDADKRFARLHDWARERFPELGAVRHRWSGQVMDTADYAAFIGLNPGNKRIYVATGDSGQGITHGVAASLLLSGLIGSGDHEWAEVYDPSRKPIRAGGNFISAAVGVLKNMAEKLLPGDISSEDGLAAGDGGILRSGMHKHATCRDEKGELHRHEASCTHAGCVVHWNSFEQCWDCPCHGSHFAADGTALNAPAIEPLAKAEVRAKERKSLEAAS